MKIPELLSPVGSEQALTAAVNSGCDAIYIGGKDFNARAAAENFSDERLCEIIDYAHLRGVKVYITINTLYKDSELERLFDFVSLMHEKGADAFIVQDIGCAYFIKNNFKNIRLHASTQMTVHNLDGVKFLQSVGFDRVVLSRELSLAEIKYIKQNTDIEIEVFVHGALCVSYSGQCTMSSVIGQRSGNRGKCAQTCRLTFELLKNGKAIKNGYLLSTKDIMTLGNIKDFAEIGVNSLKIEGRMKTPDYVSSTTQIYRNQLDKYKSGDVSVKSEDVKKLLKAFNRGGSFSNGYLNCYSGENMMSTETPKNTGLFIGKVSDYDYKTKKCKIKFAEKITAGDGIEIFTKNSKHVGSYLNRDAEPGKELVIEIDGKIKAGDLVYRTFDKKLNDESKRIYSADTRKLKIYADLKAKIGEKLVFTLKYNDVKISICGDAVLKAENKPLSKEDLLDRFSKTGNTPFIIEFDSLDTDDDIFINISNINNLRRNAVELFEKKYVNSFYREKVFFEIPKSAKTSNNNKKINVSICSKSAFDAVLDTNSDNIFLDIHTADSDFSYFYNSAESNNKNLFIELPLITRDEDMIFIEKFIDKYPNQKNYLIKNYGQLNLLKDRGFKLFSHSSFNVTNGLSYEFMKKYTDKVSLSTELNFDEINKFAGGEITVYGKLTLMSLCQCPIGNFEGEKNNERFCSERFSENKYSLKDRKDLIFDIKPNCFECYAEILNSGTILMTDKLSDISKSPAEAMRLIFTDENEMLIKSVIAAYNSKTDDEVFKFIMNGKNLTHAHFYRGVL